MDLDLACTLSLAALVLALAVAYAVRVARAGRAHYARVDREGKSALLAKSVMEMLCWCVQPVVGACVRLGITPDAVTYASLVLGVAAGGAFAVGHLGVGALLAVAAGAGDAIDGLLARRLGVQSTSGEVLDAAVDRYVDFALLGGLALHLREQAPHLALALLALLAAFMVSYSTAKAEALHVVPPRGSMRRIERSVLVIGSTALAPVSAAVFGPTWTDTPVLVALGVIAVVGNASAIQRLATVRTIMRERDSARGADFDPEPEPDEPESTPPSGGEEEAAPRAAE
jgi:CDP-diacylglycerol--glycerol-3-phosphate 3-phosphatidyltransferase